MNDVIKFLLRWSEVWPLLIPLAIFLILGLRERKILPVMVFIITSFSLMLIANYTVYYPEGLPTWLKNNNIFYNILTVTRTLLIGWFIINIPQLKIYKYTKYLYGVYLAAVIINFTIFQNPLNISSRVFVAENIIMLLLCITYFLGTILDEENKLIMKDPEFLVCAGISLFEAINFFINLFFHELYRLNPDFGFLTIKISKYTNILLGILLGLALYQSYKRAKTAINPVLN